MEEPYKVTVGIPLYNCEKYIERCLTSIINQTYSNIEIIIINDGSIDNSLAIVEKIREKNKLKNINIYSKKNEGPSMARNDIIQKATGEFLLIVDSDDWIEDTTIEELVHMQTKYDSDIVKMNYYISLNEKNNKKNKSIIKKYKNHVIDIEKDKIKIAADIINGNITSYTWSMLIRKDIIKEDLYFEKDINHLEDKIFLLKLIANVKKMYFSEKPLYHYFLNVNGLMHKHDCEYYLNNDIKINLKIKEIIKKYYSNDFSLLAINNAISSYGIERNLFNIYKTTNEQKMIEEYNKIKEDWKQIAKETDYKYLKQSKYAIRGDYFIKKWEKNNVSNVTKAYDKEKHIENIKKIIKKIVRR